MKLSRVLAATAGVALVGTSAFAFVAPASAADITAPAAPFPAETNPYAAGWFTGSGSIGASGTDAVYGLSLASPPGVNNTYQVLNGTPITGDLTSLVEDARVYVTRGVATFQIPVFGEPGQTDQEFTTLRPADATVPGAPFIAASAPWITSGAIGTYAAGSTATLAEFETALSAGVPYQILAFGAAVGNGQSGSISQIYFAGNTHLFRAGITGTQSATTVSRAQSVNPGITFNVTGLVPNEPIVISGSSANGSGIISQGDLFADATGNFRYTYTSSAAVPADLGVNDFFFFGEYSGFSITFAVTITEDVAVAAVPTRAQLAATGTDLTGGVVAGGLLLLVGAGFAFVATRRRLGNRA